ncbi:MAG: ribosomal-protein-alanine N-acetyltransferase [Kiritimatiellia bacterium]|jgi:ribosomal-protein-alanine N-acetyltransferase
MQLGLIELTSERLRFRQLESEDAEALFDIYSDSEVMKYWSSLPFASINQARELISNTHKWWEAGDAICCAIEESGSNLVIGTLSLFNFHEESKRAEIGYILGRSCWG